MLHPAFNPLQPGLSSVIPPPPTRLNPRCCCCCWARRRHKADESSRTHRRPIGARLTRAFGQREAPVDDMSNRKRRPGKVGWEKRIRIDRVQVALPCVAEVAVYAAEVSCSNLMINHRVLKQHYTDRHIEVIVFS